MANEIKLLEKARQIEAISTLTQIAAETGQLENIDGETAENVAAVIRELSGQIVDMLEAEQRDS